jgi:iron-sulfur cluster repair protein YtfE (RIC family)
MFNVNAKHRIWGKIQRLEKENAELREALEKINELTADMRLLDPECFKPIYEILDNTLLDKEEGK